MFSEVQNNSFDRDYFEEAILRLQLGFVVLEFQTGIGA